MKYKLFATIFFTSVLLVNGAYAQNTYYLPQVANGSYGGGSYKTTFVLFNNTSTRATGSLTLTDDNGSPLTLTITGQGTNNSFPIDLPAGASAMWQTDGLGAVVVGAATVTSTANIGVSAIFSIYDSQGRYVAETGVGNSVPATKFVLPVDTTGFSNTGLALYNSSGGPVTISMSLFDTTGTQFGSTLVLPTLGTGNHRAQFVAGAGQLFPPAANFQGTLVVQCSSPIAAMVLRQYQNPPTLSYTSLPIVPTSSPKTAVNLAQVANGGGYQTSFLIFNISTSPANVSLSLTKDNGSPLSVTLPGRGTNSSFSFPNLAPGASLFLQTDGAPATTDTGAATITSNVPIGAAGVFTVRNAGVFQTETGVGDSAVLTSFTVPVDITGSFNTALAFFNPNSSAAPSLTFRLLNSSGGQVGTEVKKDLSGQPHLAIFVDQIFPGTSNFRGSLAVTSTVGVAAMTLRYNSSPLSYTTLPAVSGTYAGSPAGSALLSKTETGVTATSDVTLNETLPAGYKLTGTISGPGRGTTVAASANQNSTFTGSVNQATGKYLVVLPADTYSLKVSFIPPGVPSGQNVIVTSSVSGSITISGDTTYDITLPAVSLFTVSGSVNGLSNLPSTTGMKISFSSNDSSIQADFNLAADGSYQGVLPAGTYTAGITSSFTSAPPAFQFQSLGIYNLGSATITGNSVIPAFTVPATAKLSGTIHGVAPPVAGASVGAISTSLSVIGVSSADILTSQYQMVLVKNIVYGVTVAASLTQGTSLLGTISFPMPATSLNLTGDTANFDFTIPALPARVTISGRVTDSNGSPVSSAIITALSQSITGSPNLQYSTFAQTDANGNYSMSVLSGTNYQLTYTPPAPNQ